MLDHYNHDQPLLAAVNGYEPLWTFMNPLDHDPVLTTIKQYQPSSTIMNHKEPSAIFTGVAMNSLWGAGFLWHPGSVVASPAAGMKFLSHSEDPQTASMVGTPGIDGGVIQLDLGSTMSMRQEIAIGLDTT